MHASSQATPPLFGIFYMQSTLEKDSKKAPVTVTVAPICKIKSNAHINPQATYYL
jgi:hypothetical protein